MPATAPWVAIHHTETTGSRVQALGANRLARAGGTGQGAGAAVLGCDSDRVVVRVVVGVCSVRLQGEPLEMGDYQQRPAKRAGGRMAGSDCGLP